MIAAFYWIGGVMTAAGLAGLGWCMREAARIKNGDLPPDEARGKLGRLVAVNVGAVSLAFMGLAFIAVAAIMD